MREQLAEEDAAVLRRLVAVSHDLSTAADWSRSASTAEARVRAAEAEYRRMAEKHWRDWCRRHPGRCEEVAA